MGTYCFAQAACLGETVCYDLLCEEGIVTRYGIGIRYGGEELRISDLSTRIEVVCGLLERMAAGAVTPVTARDIVEDWLGV